MTFITLYKYPETTIAALAAIVLKWETNLSYQTLR
jgi:hypothetical protein